MQFLLHKTNAMFNLSKVDPVNEKNALFHELLEACKHSSPSSRLPYSLRNRLEKFPPDVRREIVNRLKVGCSPLFIACKKGQTEIVDYLVTVCHADIEQKGIFEVIDDRSNHLATPLWCAAVSGRLSIVELLIKHKADVNAVSDTGSTPVRSACFMTHLDIVKFLIEHGADINRPNYNGGTCLINSVQSAPLCEYLLEHGASVNARDIQNKTALHYAIQEHRLETTKLLLKHGANYKAKSRYGDDALQMACLKGAIRIFEHLTSTISYPLVKLANAHELLGATFLDEHNDTSMALHHWRHALTIRIDNKLLPKTPKIELKDGYRDQTEFETFTALENISTDLDLIRIQSLLIAERILGPHHKDTIFRLMYRGASYADMLRYQRCIDLWRRALRIRIEKDSILYTDTCFAAQALVREMIEYYDKRPPKNDADLEVRFNDAVAVFELCTRDVVETKELLYARPVHKRQTEFFDRIIKCVTHLIYLMTVMGKGERERGVAEELVRGLVRKNPTTINHQNSLLHMCVSRGNTIKNSYFMDDIESLLVFIFPQEEVTRMLLKCGANVHAKNSMGSTPLHIATQKENYADWLIKLLLDYGSHIDQPNYHGVCPSDNLILLLNNTENRSNAMDIHILNYVNLKCLCAKVIVSHDIPYVNQIPKTLENFIKIHTV